MVSSGGTGSGKSSLVQVLLGLYPADKGSIDLYRNGRSPLNLEQWRSWIAYVPLKKSELFKGTIRSELDSRVYIQEVSDQELWQALEIAQAKDFVSERKGSWMPLLRQEVEISPGGQKQRLSIASRSLAPSSISHPR